MNLLAALALLAAAQVPPSAAEYEAYTGMHRAAATNDLVMLKAQFASAEDPNVQDAYRRTPLHVAAYRGNHQAMQALVAAGANPDAQDKDRCNIVIIAAAANDVPTLKLALSLGAAPDLVNSLGQTALALARSRGYNEVVNVLEAAGERR